MPNWVVEGMLATSPRPGYAPGPEIHVPGQVVRDWVQETIDFGIASIICLIHDDQLPLYHRELPDGLIAYYRDAGLEVAHVPAYDQMTVPFRPEQYEEAWQAFLSLPKPVLVHCSAGMDRTGRIVRHILERLDQQDGFSAAAGS